MEPYTYLREWTAGEREKFDRLLAASIERLPFTLASPVGKAAAEVRRRNYGRAMNYSLDFFEISVQYLSCLLFALLQEAEADTDPAARKLARIVSKIDAKRPLSFGHWVSDLFTPLVQIAEQELPENPLVRSLATHVVTRRSNLLLGDRREPSIVQIRNEYKGHSTTLSEDIYRGVIYTLEPRILLLLEAMEPLQEWRFFSCESPGRIRLHNGISGRIGPTDDRTPEIGHYYAAMPETEANPEDGAGPRTDTPQQFRIDLFPLVLCNDKGYVYVFQTLKEESICYISSDENAVTLIDDCWNEAFDRRLQATSPAFDISKELNWDEMQALMAAHSAQFLERVYREKKYNSELFVDRRHLTLALEDFFVSEKTLFPLLGEAGQGKTNQLCYWTERLLNDGSGVLIFSGSDFSAVTLGDRLKEIFRFNRRKDIRKLIDSLHRKAEQQNRCVYLFFDAVNECLDYRDADGTAGPIALYNALRELFVAENYPRFKVLFTCRSYTWKHLFQRHTDRDRPFMFRADDPDTLAVRGFTDEELELAYEIYGRLYQMTTPFGSLTGSARIRLRDPLVLKIASTNYLAGEMPPSARDYTSVALFEKMLRDIDRSYAGNSQCRIVMALAHYILAAYERGTPIDSIPAGKLREARQDPASPLHALAQLVYKQDGITVAYGELLNKPERPILRLAESFDDGGEGQIQFIYERFLEYVLALAFVEREASKRGGGPIPARTYLEALHAADANVVFMGAMRNAVVMDCLRTGDSGPIVELARDHGEDYEGTLLVNEVLNVLITENYEEELFALIDRLLSEQVAGGEAWTTELNDVVRTIEANRADERVIARHKQLHSALLPVIRLRKLASVSTLNGIFLTDYFNEGLYASDPFPLLWRLMTDPIDEVGNDACLYAYYLSNRRRTLGFVPLRENLSERIVHEMYGIIKRTPVFKALFVGTYRRRSVVFLETATRITTLLIIDALLSDEANARERVGILLGEIRSIFRYITGNFSLLRILMPFFQMILRRQITFQSAYVNNAIEYQTFWDPAVVPAKIDGEGWSRESVRAIIPFVFHYSTCRDGGADERRREQAAAFRALHPQILSAYRLGDSFSYFILERVLVVMGVSDWNNIAPVVQAALSEEYRQTPWFDYSQMSLLYVLYQVGVYSAAENSALTELFGRECVDWTRRCRGFFRGRNSRKANPTGLYKRNVMNWYCVVVCTHAGDRTRYDDGTCTIPRFYELLDEAMADQDKELLFHLLENVSELITDFGYIRTALDLLRYIMVRFDTQERLDRIDDIVVPHRENCRQTLVQAIGNVLGTAKNYFPAEVDVFLRRDIVGLPFPGVSKYREDILNYNPSGETLSDLFTHKFGNFLMWSLLHEQTVDRFALEAISASVDAKNCFAWYEGTVRILFRQLFGVKL